MKGLIYLLLIFMSFSACENQSITISSFAETSVVRHAESELIKYLSQVYADEDFKLVEADTTADIQFLLTHQLSSLGYKISDLPLVEESYKVVTRGGKLLIISPDERGLLNAAYYLLEQQGCGFYISEDVIPESKRWNGFEEWVVDDFPLVGDRFLFNWHNFLSGCTGWDLEDWKLWIDQANKMRYNGIMVHAYGNNPMFSYDYLGETKQTGYLNNSTRGRDWGNQHVNDVRRVEGGEIFSGPAFGAKPSFASDENKVAEITQMMHEVFQYAEQRGTRVIFALDFDTWMSHPQNIVEQLPGEAVFDIHGHLTPNPDHPEGYKYYMHQLEELITKYPQIDELTAWSRAPKNKVISVLGTIWMAFPFEKFPAEWQTEYRKEMSEHSHLKDDLRTQGMFAFSKIVSALQRAASEIKPGLKIGYGSWSFDWLEIADVFLPEEVSFRPLDARIVFESEESRLALSNVADTREIYPVVWAHHDDFAHIGRPFTPFLNLSDLVAERKIAGLGIIHWNTHPLDLYFTSTSKQLWNFSTNESLEETIHSYVSRTFGQSSIELENYYMDWLTDGPIFGRETSDHFIDLGKLHWKSTLKNLDTLTLKAQKRLTILEAAPEEQKNFYWEYQKGMEEFYISFFENQAVFFAAYDLTERGEIAEARELMRCTSPENTIRKYVEAISRIGFSSGEKALVLSLNTRWKVDYENLKQRLGLEPVRIRFSPTSHDPLAQVPGTNTYNIDEDGEWWICYWKHDLPDDNFTQKKNRPALVAADDFNFFLKTMHGQALPPGSYILSLNVEVKEETECSILEDHIEIARQILNKGEKTEPIKFSGKGGSLELKIKSDDELYLHNLVISPDIN